MREIVHARDAEPRPVHLADQRHVGQIGDRWVRADLPVPLVDPYAVVVIAGHRVDAQPGLDAVQCVEHLAEAGRVVGGEVSGQGDQIRPLPHRQLAGVADHPEGSAGTHVEIRE